MPGKSVAHRKLPQKPGPPARVFRYPRGDPKANIARRLRAPTAEHPHRGYGPTRRTEKAKAAHRPSSLSIDIAGGAGEACGHHECSEREQEDRRYARAAAKPGEHRT